MVHFPHYKGPTIAGTNCVPIVPKQFTWTGMKSHKPLSRTQLPLQLAWAVTIHKAQGLTIPKCILNLGSADFQAGLTYVGFSRVRALTDIFIACCSFERFLKIARSKHFKEVKKEFSRLSKLGLKPHSALLLHR